MPRIDPQQLLTCLKPLLAPQGGIKSESEVARIASLMEKYSKKLVSKCIYIQILKNTGADLLDQFMSLGGWTLVHQWLHDGNDSQNWPFVTEILEMFLLCPVESSRLKLNKTPLIVKELDNNPPNQTVKQLAGRLVKQWLEIALNDQQRSQENKPPLQNGLNGTVIDSSNNVNKIVIKKEKDGKTPATAEEVKYKISNKDSNGKLLLSLKRSTSPSTAESIKEPKIPKIETNGVVVKKEETSGEKSKDDKKKSSSSSSSSHKSSSSSSKSSHRDKERSSSSSHKSSSSSSKDKDKHHKSSSSSSKSSSSSSSRDRDKSRDKDKERERRKREEKEKAEKAQAEKDKETLSFLQPTATLKMQKIPKRQHSTENGDAKPSSEPPVEKKKPSMSIEVRADKPKTVKTLNSQFRDHGLAAEAPKPPSRKDIKKPGSAPSQIIASAFAPQPKQTLAPTVTSPTAVSPPTVIKKQLEKALEVDNVPERVGGVKLIKPKPLLFDSIGFMDALDASASTTKKDGKKRKRLPSGSSSSKKEDPESPKGDQKPLKFYKDTMEEEKDDDASANGETSPTKELDASSTSATTVNDEDSEMKENGESSNETSASSPKKEEAKSPKEEIEVPDVPRKPGPGCGPDGPPGVLVNPLVPRRKKRSLRWRDNESDDAKLTDVRLFELDENERANVTKTFSEQIQAEHGNERKAFHGGFNVRNDEYMPEQTAWRRLIPITVDNPSTVVPGQNSEQKKIQADRERSVLQDIFFSGIQMNESPVEPDYESYDHVEPLPIPLTNESNPEQVSQYDDWPLPRGDPLDSIPMHSAFGSVFGGIVPNLNIPSLNPLNPLNLNLGGIQSRDSPMWSTPPAFVQQPPPNMMPAMGLGNQNRGNFNNYSRSNSNNSNNNNQRRNNAGGAGGGGNWVRGNAPRRGTCHAFKRTGRCNNNSCQYIHER